MPELPEVQTVVDDLAAAGLPGSCIRQVRVYWPASVDRPAPTEFGRTLPGLCVRRIDRRAKYIVMTLTAGWTLLVHLRMTGRLMICEGVEFEPAPHEHVILQLDRQRQLRFFDTRKFGRFYLTRTPADILGRLVPEPLTPAFTARRLFQGLQDHASRLKPLLLNQTFVAGLGNIYVDEALWQARIHPCRVSNSLNLREAAGLHRAVRKVLRSGLRHLGTSLGQGQTHFFSAARRRGAHQHHLKVFRRAGESCYGCGAVIVRRVVAQRSTFICPVCQPAPKEKP